MNEWLQCRDLFYVYFCSYFSVLLHVKLFKCKYRKKASEKTMENETQNFHCSIGRGGGVKLSHFSHK